VPVVHKHAVLNRTSVHCYWSGQPRGKECRPPRPPRPTYWVLPTQNMSGSRGSPCNKSGAAWHRLLKSVSRREAIAKNWCPVNISEVLIHFCCSTVHFDNIKVFLTNKCTVY
jgi:hypothetical protein